METTHNELEESRYRIIVLHHEYKIIQCNELVFSSSQVLRGFLHVSCLVCLQSLEGSGDICLPDVDLPQILAFCLPAKGRACEQVSWH